jgi:glycosyltransferase involved in cell wall biosynthesis
MSKEIVQLVSVLISTYDNPRFLERTVMSYERQTFRNFEVIVTDDGSGPETEQLIRSLQSRCGFDLRHVRQDDRGFRLARVRNLGLAAARGEYVVFTDQDCLAGAGFLAAHRQKSRRRRIVQGGRRHFTKSVTKAILSRPVDWLNRLDLRAYSIRHLDEDILVHAFARRFGALTGSNVAGFREDFLSVGGFDEKYSGWGGEDLDLGYRLWRDGCEIAHLGDGPGTVFHLFHSARRNFVSPTYLRLYLDIARDVFLPWTSRFNPRRSRGLGGKDADKGSPGSAVS